MRPLRTLLFVPGNDARRSAKALGTDADAAILDLEDAVAESEKVAARTVVAESLARERATPCYVRVNGWDTALAHADLLAVVAAGLDGIVLPKVEAAHQLLAIDWLLGQLERERGLAYGGVDLIALVETARGLTAVDAIAGCG